MSRLGELFQKYGTDKYVNGYAGVYECLFHGFKPTRLLEVGIGTMDPSAPWSMAGYAQPGYTPGGSLRAWRDYFGGCSVYGMDIADDTQVDEAFIRTIRCDSADRLAVKEAIDKISRTIEFDIIIDDGAHNVDSQIQTLSNLWEYVRNEGFYIIEDIMPGYASEVNEFAIRITGNRPMFLLGPKSNMLVIRKV